MSFVSKPTREWTVNCRDCKQRISKLLNGGRIVNDENGPGGPRNERHICPNRLQTGAASSGDQKMCNTKFKCHRCWLVYDGVFVCCPFCFMLICQRCGYEQHWRRDKHENRCKKCDYPFLDLTEMTVYEPLSQDKWQQKTDILIKSEGTATKCDVPQIQHLTETGTYRRKTKQELGWKPVIPNMTGIKQVTGCARYGHILRPGDKNCRVCHIGVIR